MVFCQYGINNNISFMTVQKMQRMKISGNSEFHVLSDHWSKSSKNRFQFKVGNKKFMDGWRKFKLEL